MQEESIHKQYVFASKKKTHDPVSVKTHHTNQSHNYMAKHVIWLLRNRGSCGRHSGERVTVAVAVTETAIECEF